MTLAKIRLLRLRLVIKKIESKENDYLCALCGERYVDPPTEDWIQCSLCNSWWHEQCTSYENGIFICDICADN